MNQVSSTPAWNRRDLARQRARPGVYVKHRKVNTTSMNAALIALYIALGLAAVAFVIGAIRAARRRKDRRWPTPAEILVGFVTDFFDTLGIGSFAPTTAIYKLRRMVPDELIPGTLNVGHTPAAFTESLIFVTAIVVDPVLLVTVIVSAAAGAWLGAGIVARLPRRAIQITMGIALLIAGIGLYGRQFGRAAGRRDRHDPGGLEIRSSGRHQLRARRPDERRASGFTLPA